MQPAMSSRGGRVLWAIALLALAGAAVSSVSLYHHYDSSPSAFCDFGANFNCDMVNRSIYSVVFGIPVALIGILGYGVLLILSTLYRAKAEVSLMLLIASLAGLGFALYLTFVEAFVLAVWCILCLSSLALIAAITALASVLVAQRVHKI